MIFALCECLILEKLDWKFFRCFGIQLKVCPNFQNGTFFVLLYFITIFREMWTLRWKYSLRLRFLFQHNLTTKSPYELPNRNVLWKHDDNALSFKTNSEYQINKEQITRYEIRKVMFQNLTVTYLPMFFFPGLRNFHAVSADSWKNAQCFWT